MKKQKSKEPLKQPVIREQKQKQAAPARQDRTWLWFSLAIALLAVVLYANTLQNGYALDDKGIITLNKFTTKGFSGIPDLMTTSYWEGIGLNVRSYRPLSPVTFAIEVGLFGMSPAAGHFGNLLLCILTGVLLLFFLKRLFRAIDPALPSFIPFLVTALFIAHPIHTEVVANIKGRDSMLEFFFLLLSGYFLFGYISSRRTADLVWSVVAYFPALLSKESAITYLVMVPVILVLFDDRPLTKKAFTSMIFLVPAFLFLLLYYQFSNIKEFTQLHVMDNALLFPAPAATILATKLLITGKYLALLIWPHPLVFDYSYNTIPFTTFADPAVWLSVLVYLAAAAFLVVVLLKKITGRKTGSGSLLFAFSTAWFFMGFIASSNLFMLIGSTMGERFMYGPSLGFLAIVVWFAWYAVSLIKGISVKSAAAVLFFLCGVVMTGYAAKTISRNRAWKDDMTLFTTDLEYLGRNAKVHDFIGNLYSGIGDKTDDPALKKESYLKAIGMKEKALEIYPGIPEIRQKIGYLYGYTGQFDKAIEAYKLAIRLNPGEINNYIQIGKAFGMTGRVGEGLPFLQQAEKIDPENAQLLGTLGIAYAQTGRIDLAISCFEKAVARDPSDSQIRSYLDLARKQVGKPKN